MPVIITLNFFSEYVQISALMVFLGHIFPIWLKFKGGKGVATYLGNFVCTFIFTVEHFIYIHLDYCIFDI